MLAYAGTLHTSRRLSLNETATAFQADLVAFCKQTDFNGGPYRPLHDGGVGAGSQPSCYVTLQRRLVSKHHRLMLLRYKMTATL